MREMICPLCAARSGALGRIFSGAALRKGEAGNFSAFGILRLLFDIQYSTFGVRRFRRGLARLAHVGRACARVCRRGGCGARRFGLVIMRSFLADFSIARNWDYEFY